MSIGYGPDSDLSDGRIDPADGDAASKLTLLTRGVSFPDPQNQPLTSASNSPHTSNGSVTDETLLAGIRDGEWLEKQTFPALEYAVQGLIPEGLTLLIGPPKAGKSWLILSLLLAVASGGMALGRIRTGDACPVLYLALEDGDRRMQDRCRALLGPNNAIPTLFSYQTTIIPGQLIPTIEAWMRCHPNTKLIVVDTLGKVMPPTYQGESAYQRDYRIAGALKRLADTNPGLAVVVLHHDRKASSEDFVDSVSATHGLAGGADTITVLARRRQSDEGSLKITGRDVREGEYAIRLVDGKAWQLDGRDLQEAAAIARNREDGQELSGSMTDLLAYIRNHPTGVKAGDLKDKFGGSVYTYLSRLTDSGRIHKLERGLYVATGS